MQISSYTCKNCLRFFDKKIETTQQNPDYTNYRYASGFVDTLLKMPYWKSWMKTIDMQC